ncbi:P-loop NTPase fold protein [Dryocola sp. LX212]
MKIDDIEWNWSEANEFLGEYLPADTLDRKKYAKFLYEICAARGENSNLVVNINAEWGAGKTYFTKRLAQSISNAHPTVYIDAWKEDFSDDPLLTVFSSIKEQLTGQSDKFTTLLNKTIENIGPLLKTATPLLLEGIIKKISGIENISSLTKDLSTKLLELHTEKATKITTIKKGISTWVRYIKQKDGTDKSLPLFIVIDELDRCRPDFAISLLEITKHIFNIPGVVFIIATDTEQLQHSIKVVYGSNFSASHYLSRFFDRRFLLPTPSMREFLKTITADSIIDDFDNLRKKISPSPPDITSFIDNCASIFESMKVNLRDSIKLYERLLDLILTSPKNFDSNFLLILSIINSQYNDKYSFIKADKFDKQQIIDFDSNISLTFDLSRLATGVHVLMHNGMRHQNSFKNKTITIHLYQYIEKARINIEIALPVTDAGGYMEDWSDGGLERNDSLDTMLKIGWAKNKTYDKSLLLPQYFELIELSTTFE